MESSERPAFSAHLQGVGLMLPRIAYRPPSSRGQGAERPAGDSARGPPPPPRARRRAAEAVRAASTEKADHLSNPARFVRVCRVFVDICAVWPVLRYIRL